MDYYHRSIIELVRYMEHTTHSLTQINFNWLAVGQNAFNQSFQVSSFKA